MPKKISLSVKCPHCGTSFMDENRLLNNKPSIKLNIETSRARGIIRLCSIYGCFDHQSNIILEENEVAKFFCPHCNKEVISQDVCNVCEAPMIPLNLKTGGTVYICSRKGCSKHFLAFEDIDTEIRIFYNEYGIE